MNIFSTANLNDMQLQNSTSRPFSIAGRAIVPGDAPKTLMQLGIDFCTFKQLYIQDSLVQSWFDLGIIVSTPIVGSTARVCTFETPSGGTGGGSSGTVSTTAPSNPTAGATWVRLPDAAVFTWDSVRSKWLGLTKQYTVGRGFYSTPSSALYGVGDTPTSQTPIRIAHNETLVGCTLESNSVSSWSVEIRDFATHIPVAGSSVGITGAKTANDSTLNLDLTEGQEIQIYLTTATGVSFPRAILYTKERG